MDEAWAAIFLLLTDSWDEFDERYRAKVPFLNNGSLLSPPASSCPSLSSPSTDAEDPLSPEQEKTSQDIMALFNSSKKKRIRGKVYGQSASTEDERKVGVGEERSRGEGEGEGVAGPKGGALSLEEVNECYRFFSHRMKEALSRLQDSLTADER